MRVGHATVLAGILCGLACVHPAAAQNWPSRPLTMVVPFAAGGGTDVLGRIVGRRLSEILGQQVIVENVGGAGGMVGSARVVKAPPDGYQFVLGSRADAGEEEPQAHPRAGGNAAAHHGQRGFASGRQEAGRAPQGRLTSGPGGEAAIWSSLRG